MARQDTEDETAAYQALLEEADRIAASVAAAQATRAPPRDEIEAQFRAKDDAFMDRQQQPLRELQQRINDRAAAHLEITSGAHSFKELDWSNASARPRSEAQALAVLSGDNLNDFRQHRQQIEMAEGSMQARLITAYGVHAPLTVMQKEEAARHAARLVLDAPQEHAPAQRIPTREEAASSRVTQEFLRSQQPAISEMINPRMQERAREEAASAPQPLDAKTADYQRRQDADAIREARFARARENDTPHNRLHRERQADNEQAVQLTARLAEIDKEKSASHAVEDPAKGYSRLSVGVSFTHEIPADYGQYQFLTPNAAAQAEAAPAEQTQGLYADIPAPGRRYRELESYGARNAEAVDGKEPAHATRDDAPGRPAANREMGDLSQQRAGAQKEITEASGKHRRAETAAVYAEQSSGKGRGGSER